MGLDADVLSEVEYKVQNGGRQVSLAAMDAELRAIGYRLDRDLDCRSLNRHISGPRAGRSYPAVNMYVVQVSDGMSAFHVDARRDANFTRLQEMRFNGEIFAVSRGRIHEI